MGIATKSKEKQCKQKLDLELSLEATLAKLSENIILSESVRVCINEYCIMNQEQLVLFLWIMISLFQISLPVCHSTITIKHWCLRQMEKGDNLWYLGETLSRSSSILAKLNGPGHGRFREHSLYIKYNAMLQETKYSMNISKDNQRTDYMAFDGNISFK